MCQNSVCVYARMKDKRATCFITGQWQVLFVQQAGLLHSEWVITEMILPHVASVQRFMLLCFTAQTAEGLLLFGEVRPLGCLSFLLLCLIVWRWERVSVCVVTAPPEALESLYHWTVKLSGWLQVHIWGKTAFLLMLFFTKVEMFWWSPPEGRQFSE